jgi:enoyl-CoA hydratase/carnithine racemase
MDATLTEKQSAVLLKKDGGIATITLNRPTALNSLNEELLDGMLAALRDVAEDHSVRVVVPEVTCSSSSA